MTIQSLVCRLVASLCLCALAGAVAAQGYPTKPVKILVGFPPGGAVDVLARIFADKFSALWSQPALVENRAGATGNIASDLAAKAAPDGYTILFTANTHVTNGALYSKLPYDPIRDFTPISQVTYYSLVLVAHPSVAAKTLADLVALAKANPGKLLYNSAGNGTPTHLTAELFRGAARIDAQHVPYKGSAAATTDLLAGRVQFAFSNPIVALPQVKAGRLRPLATTGAKRSPIFPEIPTMAESGYPGLEAGTWHLFLGPAGLPRDIVNKLAGDIVAVLQMSDVRERLAALGVEPIGTTPEQLAAIMRSEMDKWTKVIRAANIKLD
ncbi:MAG: tripartite tricarboxylate transporter substrate binding protein [Betaproteobacteria bacterium]|nr:tripartite tricarboxylate transporter substrate binding protein [Betaproteobacteria bacterium]